MGRDLKDPFEGQPYASEPLSEEAKVFLVAGGDDVANFAADVLQQRRDGDALIEDLENFLRDQP